MPDRIDTDELRRIADDLHRLGMRRSSARILAAIEAAPDERVAPVQDRSSGLRAIPWGLHELLWRVYRDHGHRQSAERMAERGGFARAELGMLAVGAYSLDDQSVPRGRTIPLLDLYRASLPPDATPEGGETRG